MHTDSDGVNMQATPTLPPIYSLPPRFDTPDPAIYVLHDKQINTGTYRLQVVISRFVVLGQFMAVMTLLA